MPATSRRLHSHPRLDCFSLSVETCSIAYGGLHDGFDGVSSKRVPI